MGAEVSSLALFLVEITRDTYGRICVALAFLLLETMSLEHKLARPWRDNQ